MELTGAGIGTIQGFCAPAARQGRSGLEWRLTLADCIDQVDQRAVGLPGLLAEPEEPAIGGGYARAGAVALPRRHSITHALAVTAARPSAHNRRGSRRSTTSAASGKDAAGGDGLEIDGRQSSHLPGCARRPWRPWMSEWVVYATSRAIPRLVAAGRRLGERLVVGGR